MKAIVFDNSQQLASRLRELADGIENGQLNVRSEMHEVVRAIEHVGIINGNYEQATASDWEYRGRALVILQGDISIDWLALELSKVEV